eukprot:1561772-Alexandrium_andersonii.AAC.1
MVARAAVTLSWRELGPFQGCPGLAPGRWARRAARMSSPLRRRAWRWPMGPPAVPPDCRALRSAFAGGG